MGRSTPVWMLLLVGVGAVAITLAAVFVVYRAMAPAPPVTVVAGVAVAATPGAPPTADASAIITPAAAAGAASCSTQMSESQALSQARRWPDAAAKLEAVRGQCDVVGPLYDAYLNQARALADDERGADAMAFFDKALQVKNGTEASTEKGLAQAYQDGRAAVGRQDWDTAIANLSRVQATNSNYARGNNTLNLINAYLAQGDQLVTQGQCGAALSDFQRADVLKPNEAAIAQRISVAQQCGRPTLVPAPVAPAAPLVPVAAAPAAPAVVTPALEATVRAYYDAINARRFADAYRVLSSSAQASQSLASFAGRFNATRAIGLRFVDAVSSDGTSAQLNAHTQTVTQGRTGLSTSCSRVVWELVVESGQWRRDIRSESNNEFGEAC